jgi:hypothetical protein
MGGGTDTLPETRTRGSNGSLRRRAAFGTDIDGLFDSVLRSTVNPWAAWMPTADRYETTNEFVLEIGLTGFSHDDIDVTLERGVRPWPGGEAPARRRAEGCGSNPLQTTVKTACAGAEEWRRLAPAYSTYAQSSFRLPSSRSCGADTWYKSPATSRITNPPPGTSRGQSSRRV